ncbi:unnamed protein product, partial [Iphiclides podalirius]
MDVVGSEIGQKMRSAIKAKLTELGCYVDDELPDYVMVMVANKRTRAQMDEDLQLFLGDNTDLFVNWLHQVLKKLQEVTVTAPLKVIEGGKIKERSQSKERKVKEKKEKKKSDSSKKSKKKEKEKSHKKKEDRKAHKNKKKSKHHGMIRPNVPPLLMNIEKQSEPSITDVFAGQILKNHGITLEDDNMSHKTLDEKSLIKEIKRPILPIIDPATISSQPESLEEQMSTSITSASSAGGPRDEQSKEMNDSEMKVCGQKQKSSEQIDSISDDEDFLNIRTEAEELMNDFAEESLPEISHSAPVATPPLASPNSPPSQSSQQSLVKEKNIPEKPEESLPHIELNLPKRPIRERLGAREVSKDAQVIREKEKVTATKPAESPERFTPERHLDVQVATKSAKSRLGSSPELPTQSSGSEETNGDKYDHAKSKNSKVSVLESRPQRSSCASVVRVRPRPRVSAPASNLLLKAVADAHKSLLNAPPKVELEKQKVKRALVLPMRRCVDAKNIVIQVPSDVRTGVSVKEDDMATSQTISAPINKADLKHMQITKVIKNTDYLPSRAAVRKDDKMIIETINIHNPTVDKDRDTQFIVTMDGYLPNAFLAKKLMMEGLLDDEDIDKNQLIRPPKSVLRATDKREIEKAKVAEQPKVKGDQPSTQITHKVQDEESEESSDTLKKDSSDLKKSTDTCKTQKRKLSDSTEKTNPVVTCPIEKKRLSDSSDIQMKRLSDASEESDTQVIIKQEPPLCGEKRKGAGAVSESENSEKALDVPPVKKRKASPIVFDADKVEKEADRSRERTQSASSDSHVIVTTATNSHKYDTLPPLSQAEKRLVWCRSFPLCRYGAACAFAHPRCKFAAACTRRGCVYAHDPPAAGAPPPATGPALSSHVVPAANYKTICAAGVANMCKFYPNCVNPACHFYHPKPCRYGKACVNKLECNFYHNDVPSGKWKHPV